MRYRIEVLPESEGDVATFYVDSHVPIADELLKVAGLTLDFGVAREQLEADLQTANAYVKVACVETDASGVGNLAMLVRRLMACLLKSDRRDAQVVKDARGYLQRAGFMGSILRERSDGEGTQEAGRR